MKKTILSILLILAVAAAMFFLLSKKPSPVTTSQPETSQSETSYQADQTVCYGDDNYYVIHQPVVQNTGSNILVKYKKSPEETFPCKYSVSDGDFELKNPEGADYFMAIISHFLVVDSGTAVNNRGITLYDLDSRKEVFHDQYYAEPVITSTSIDYWATAQDQSKAGSCPDGYESSGVILAHTILDLKTLTKKVLSETRCS